MKIKWIRIGIFAAIIMLAGVIYCVFVYRFSAHKDEKVVFSNTETQALNISPAEDETLRDTKERKTSRSEQTDSNEMPNSNAQGMELVEISYPLIYVHVCGAVKKPGVYPFTDKNRVIDAVNAAGGFAADAAGDEINQAELLFDGARLYIPTITEASVKQQDIEEKSSDPAVFGLIKDGPNNNEADGKEDFIVNINTAGLEELMTLPGIGESKATSILNYRKEHGLFLSVEELKQIPGIKEASYAKLKSYVMVE